MLKRQMTEGQQAPAPRPTLPTIEELTQVFIDLDTAVQQCKSTLDRLRLACSDFAGVELTTDEWPDRDIMEYAKLAAEVIEGYDNKRHSVCCLVCRRSVTMRQWKTEHSQRWHTPRLVDRKRNRKQLV